LLEQRSTLDARLSTLATEREALSAEHSALATSHSLLATEREALSTLLDVLTKGRIAQDEQMEKILSENKSLLSARDAAHHRISELEHEVAQLRDHAKLLDEEFGKAEGQLDLIKDIFLRETLR
jgi:chromosome segregation ATPase